MENLEKNQTTQPTDSSSGPDTVPAHASQTTDILTKTQDSVSPPGDGVAPAKGQDPVGKKEG
ncbi:MAG: hypothetical protein COX20_12865, partial [Desulfobacterales bacterium CG23_combo_of_CG06-09_8_20_14_all_52_9]